MKFIKAHHLGNDFIFIKENIYKDKIIFLCNRYVGIGADGVIIVDEKQQSMSIFNSDGTRANMCGNALLCIGKLYPFWNEVYVKNKLIKIKHLDEYIDINIGTPRFLINYPNKFKNHNIYNVEIENKHMICLVDDVDTFDLINFAKDYQKKYDCNVSIISDIYFNSFRIRTFELGANETNACGSGISSSFFVLRSLGLIDKNAKCYTKLGEVNLYDNKSIHLIGNPKIVFKGEID